MLSLIILLLEFLLLYVLSRIFIQKIYIALLRIFGHGETAGLFLGLIFLPGTFVHEISHFLTALFLLVPVGELSLWPEHSENGINLGSVKIGKTDFFRGTLIGLAPFLVGNAIILLGIKFAVSSGFLSNLWFLVLIVYGIFEITHTMFSSNRDLFAVIPLAVFLIIISLVLIYFKKYFIFIFLVQKIIELSTFFQTLSLTLIIPIILEILFLFFFRKVRI